MSDPPTQDPVSDAGGAGKQAAPVPELAGRAEQVGAIIVKTLDLAEAGLSLGITVLSRAGAAAQGAITDRMPVAPGAAPAPGQGPGYADGHAHPDAHARYEPPSHAPTDRDAEPQVSPEDDAFFLANRVPLAPGGEVRVSFSITNDSLLDAKRVSLRVEALVGEHQGVRLDGGAFAVRPARKTIAPVDFDKFVLVGTVPDAAPADVYRGAVIVHSSEEMTIPVRLIVAVP